MEEDLARAEIEVQKRNVRLILLVIVYCFGGGVFMMVGTALFFGWSVWITAVASVAVAAVASVGLFLMLGLSPEVFQTSIGSVAMACMIGFASIFIAIFASRINEVPT